MQVTKFGTELPHAFVTGITRFHLSVGEMAQLHVLDYSLMEMNNAYDLVKTCRNLHKVLWIRIKTVSYGNAQNEKMVRMCCVPNRMECNYGCNQKGEKIKESSKIFRNYRQLVPKRSKNRGLNLWSTFSFYFLPLVFKR